MAINLSKSVFAGSLSQVAVSPMQQKINEALALDLLIIRFNVGASDKFGKPTTGNPDKNSKVILSSNKGQIMWSSPTKERPWEQPFMVTAQHGIAVYNHVTKNWDLPPAAVKTASGAEVPAMMAKPSALSALMIQALKEMFSDNEDMKAQVNLQTVWEEEFNFDLPGLSKDNLLQLREACLSERNAHSGRKMTRSFVMSCRFEPSFSDESVVFKIKPVALLSVEEDPIDLPSGDKILLGSNAYAEAASIAASVEVDTEALQQKMETAASNFLEKGSRNSRRNKNKKAKAQADKAKAQAGDSLSMSASSGATSCATDQEVVEEEVPMDASSIL